MQTFPSEEKRRYHPQSLYRGVAQELKRDIIDIFLYKPWISWLEQMTERRDKEIDLLVGQVLARVKIEAAYREEKGFTYAMLKCMIIRIDDNEVPEKEQEEKAVKFESKEPPTADEQASVFRQALENWNIRGNAVAVTEKYVAGHRRLVALRKRSQRIQQHKKGHNHAHP